MINEANILLWVLLTPLVGAGVLLFIPGTKKNVIRWFANIVFVLGLLVSLPLA